MVIRPVASRPSGCGIASAVLCGIALAGFLSSCGLTNVQKEGVGSFAQASSALGAASAQQFKAFRSDVIMMKTTRLAIEGKKLPAAKPDGKPADRKFYTEELNLDSGLDPDNLEKRLKAVDTLTAYGNLLQALSEKSQEKELNAAADAFMESVKKFPGNPLDAGQVEGLGKLLTMAGGLWIESGKKRVIREIVPKMSPLVRHLCDSLENDFNVKGTGFASGVDVVQDRLARESINVLKREPGSIADRAILIEGLAMANDARENLDRVTGKMLKAVASLREADKTLVELVMERQITLDAVKAFSRDVSELAKAVKPFTQK
ncbi:MAG: hypothetical protein HY896_08920 [Deltaproteobacteria bacterium]|nr:hypothetical protein [Deltaproteobacteria bacterium]